MDYINNILLEYGYIGIFISSFLSGSILPFSSEVVMVGLIASGLSPIILIIYATLGNSLGGIMNYIIGRQGKIKWIEKYLHISQKSIIRTKHFLDGHGAWLGFFSFIPIIGDAITVVLGLMRANIVVSFISIILGKLLRYAIIAWGMGLIM